MQDKIFKYVEEQLQTAVSKDHKSTLLFAGLRHSWNELPLLAQNTFLAIIKKQLNHNNAERLLFDTLWPVLSEAQKVDFQKMVTNKSDTEALNKYNSLNIVEVFNFYDFYPFTSQQIEYIVSDMIKRINSYVPDKNGRVVPLTQRIEKACFFMTKQGNEMQQRNLITSIDKMIKRFVKAGVAWNLRHPDDVEWFSTRVNRLRNQCPDYISDSTLTAGQLITEVSKAPKDSKIDHLLQIRGNEEAINGMLKLISDAKVNDSKVTHGTIENLTKAVGRLWDRGVFSNTEQRMILRALSAGVEAVEGSLLGRGFYLEILLRVDPDLNQDARQLIVSLINSPVINSELTDLLLNLFKNGRDTDRVYWCSLLNHRILHDTVISPKDRDQLLSAVGKMHEANVALSTVEEILAPKEVLNVIRKYI